MNGFTILLRAIAVDHQLAAVQESEPLKRHLPVAGQPPVFDRPSAQQTIGNMALQRHAQDVQAATPISSSDPATVQTGPPVQAAKATDDGGRRPGLLERAKASVYESLVTSLRVPQQRLITQVRHEARRLPDEVHAQIESIVDDFELITDIFISLIEAIVAVVGGIITGLVGLITGLFHIVYGLLHGLYLFSSGIVTGDFQPAMEWLKELWQTIKNIPAALKALITSWLEEFKMASTDRQTIMIGEFTGQIIALLLPAVATGGAAAGGGTGQIAGRGGQLSEIIGGASRVTSTGTRLVSVSSKVDAAAGLVSTASRASLPAAVFPTEGALALKSPLQVAAEAAVEKAPLIAPVTTPVAGSNLATTAKVSTSVLAATATAAKAGEKKQKHCGDPDLPWTQASWKGADRGERMTAEPLTRCGSQGSNPLIDLPGWRCLENAPKPPDGKRETDFWVHAHLLHGRSYGPDLHGPGDDPRNLILTDKSINIRMYLDVEQHAIDRAHWLDQTLSYSVAPRHMANSGDKRYFADGMRITLKRIDPLTRQALAILYDGTITSSKGRTPPGNCS